PRGEIAAKTALEGFDRGIAEDRPDHETVARPDPLDCRLIPARRARSDTAHRVGRTVGGFERPEHAAKGRPGHAVARPLELDPLQPARPLVHLEIEDQRNAADWDIA